MPHHLGELSPSFRGMRHNKEWEHTAKGRSTWVLTQPEAPGTWLRAGEP